MLIRLSAYFTFLKINFQGYEGRKQAYIATQGNYFVKFCYQI